MFVARRNRRYSSDQILGLNIREHFFGSLNFSNTNSLSKCYIEIQKYFLEKPSFLSVINNNNCARSLKKLAARRQKFKLTNVPSNFILCNRQFLLKM